MLKALLKKQFLGMFYGIFVNRKKGTRRSTAAIIGFICLFLFAFCSCAVAFYGMSVLFGHAMIPLGMQWLYFAMMGMISAGIGIIGSAFSAYNSIYNAQDNDLMLSLPIEPRKILFVRLVGTYLWGLFFELIAYLPAIAFYTVFSGFRLGEFLCQLATCLLLSIFILAAVCILGFIIALVASRVKNKTFTTVFFSLVLIGAYYFIYFRMNELLQSVVTNMDKIGDALKSKVYPVWQFGLAAAGNALSLAIIGAIILALFAVIYLILSKTFIKLATRNVGGAAGVYRRKTVKEKSAESTLFAKELKRFLTSSAYILNSGLGILIMLVAAVVILIKADTFGTAINSLALGFPFLSPLIPIGVASICGLVASVGCITAPSVALEGKSIWVLQSLPIEPKKIIDAKIKLQLFLTLLPTAILAAAFGTVLKFKAPVFIASVLFSVMFGTFLAVFGMLAGLINPRFDWQNETVPIKQSMAVAITLFGGWILMAVFCLGAYFLGKLITLSPAFYLGGGALVFAAATVCVYLVILKKFVPKFVYMS